VSDDTLTRGEPDDESRDTTTQGGEAPDGDSLLAEIDSFPRELPLLPLRDTVVLPLAMAPLIIGQERSLALIDEVMQGQRIIAVSCQKDPDEPADELDEIHTVGALATIHQMRRLPDGNVRIVVQGLERIRLVGLTQTDPFLRARISRHPELRDDETETEALGRAVRDQFTELVSLITELPDVLASAIETLDDLEQVAYVIGATAPLDTEQRQELLEIDHVRDKLRFLVDIINRELSIRRLGRKIATDAEKEMSKAQREYFLRQQLKQIQKELGEGDSGDAALEDLNERLDEIDLGDDVRKEVDRELRRLEHVPEASPEHGVIRTFLEWIADLPWNRPTGGDIDVKHAREVLDADHHGLDRVKDRIIEYLAVRKLRRERGLEETEEGVAEPILCLVGPPGTGKTSLGQSVARALGRKFVRISLGGVDDEAEIRGHRRTYIGAMPGRIIQAFRRTEASDPIFMLDEVDKLGHGIRGDPSAALLEVLDPAQNATFTDTYLGVPFDLSKVLFICTANDWSMIARPLLDRMETITIPGYTEEEKIAIASRYLLPRQVRAHGLTEDEVGIDDEVLRAVVREYTREAGVRELDRTMARLCRKIAQRLATKPNEPVTVKPDGLKELLGPPRHQPETAERTDRPGVATGLAWTPVGGEILFVEAAVLPRGQGRLMLTGSLGEVMQESVHAGMSYVRHRNADIGVPEDAFEGVDVHVHVPQGAIPKDGPSAGVTMVTALVSAVTGRLVRSDVAMTGEISLRGNVLPVGGIKEKVLAAHHAGIKRIILPKGNKDDLDEVDDVLREQIEFVLAATIEDVLEAVLEPPAANDAPDEPGDEADAPDAP
jgi:ATP-dependent Lon protease